LLSSELHEGIGGPCRGPGATFDVSGCYGYPITLEHTDPARVLELLLLSIIQAFFIFIYNRNGGIIRKKVALLIGIQSTCA
jgi:hypothetical protein